MDETARRASPADLGPVADLAREAISQLSALRGGSVWSRHAAHPEPVEDTLIGALSDGEPAHIAVVGTIDGTIVGYGLAHLDPLHDGRCLAVVTDLYVTPEGRGVGVGEQMLDLLIAWAREHQAVGIDALALPGDRATKNFFETFGLTARSLVVHRSFETSGPDAEPA